MKQTTIKANGPASVGALPDRGSINPEKDTKMNEARNTTSSGRPATLVHPIEAAAEGLPKISRRFALGGAFGALLGSASTAPAQSQDEKYKNLSNEEFAYLVIGMYVAMPADKRAAARQRLRDEGMPEFAGAFERLGV